MYAGPDPGGANSSIEPGPIFYFIFIMHVGVNRYENCSLPKRFSHSQVKRPKCLQHELTHASANLGMS